MRLKGGRLKDYIAVVEDTDGVTYRYVTFGRDRREAEKDARESAGRSGATLVGIKPVMDQRQAARRRQRLAAITIAVTAIMVTTTVIVIVSVGSVL